MQNDKLRIPVVLIILHIDVMECSCDQIVEVLKADRKRMTVLLFLSLLMALYGFSGTGSALGFGIGIFCSGLFLVAAGRLCWIRGDLGDIERKCFREITGQVIALFPMKESNPQGRWILMLVESSGKRWDLVVEPWLSSNEGEQVDVVMTRRLCVPVEIRRGKS